MLNRKVDTFDLDLVHITTMLRPTRTVHHLINDAAVRCLCAHGNAIFTYKISQNAEFTDKNKRGNCEIKSW